jgi:1-acyl-sn-glycerol-3-phosphate acyltransferase
MSRKFFIRRNLAKLMLKAFGWTTAGEPPPSGILVGAPHTSNWDWPATLALTWTSNIQPRLMVKQELFIPPFSWILKATGAVALDRKNPRETVRQLVEEAKSSDGTFHLALAAEGTRSQRARTGNQVFGGSRSKLACRSRWRTSTRRRARLAGVRRSIRATTSKPTWISCARFTPTR